MRRLCGRYRSSYREGSYGLGASRLRTVFGIVLPLRCRAPLRGDTGHGRIVGETAALIFTSGTNVGNVTVDVMKSQRTLAIHMYMLATKGSPTPGRWPLPPVRS